MIRPLCHVSRRLCAHVIVCCRILHALGLSCVFVMCLCRVFLRAAANYPEWFPFIEADSATAFPGGEGDENSRFRFVISIT